MYIWCSVIFCLMVSAGYIDAQPTFTPVVGDIDENSAVGTSIVLTGSGGTTPYTFSVDAQTPNLGWFEVTGTMVATGSIAIASGQTVDYEDSNLPAGGLYTVDVKIVDSTTGTALSATIAFTVTIIDVNEAPVFSLSAFAVQMSSPQNAGTALVTCDATDPDPGDTITYSIDDTTNFTISSTTGAVTVNTGVTLTNTFLTTKVHAADDGATPLTDTASLSVCIGTSRSDSTTCSGATTITGSVLAAISVLVALLMKVT